MSRETPASSAVCSCSDVDDSDGSAPALDDPHCPIHGHVPFGHCAGCGEPLERPFWDTYCFDCQRGEEDDDEWD